MRTIVLPALCTAHFGVVSPPMWTDGQGQYVKSNDWRSGGCGDTPQVPDDVEKKPEGCQVEWYTNNTYIPVDQEVTLPASLRTFGKGSWLAPGKGCGQGRDGSNDPTDAHCLEHPWGAPGTAPIYSPCGHDGGNPLGCPEGNLGQDGCAAGGYGHGPDAREWYQSRPKMQTTWAAGTVVPITWGITANHGGGYSFRLCKKTASYLDLSEECFQQGSLEFVGNSTAIFDIESGSAAQRTSIETRDVTLPTGHWRQNPVAACGDATGGAILGLCAKPYQFPPRAAHGKSPMAGFSGSGGIGGLPSTTPLIKWFVEDKVHLPAALEPGDYVLSYRFDCEQTAQVWNMCGDIKVTAASVSV